MSKLLSFDHHHRRRVTLLGERCSGTNYLEQLLVANFEVDITWKTGWKHWFGFYPYREDRSLDDIFFVGIVRDPVDWLNSLFRTPHHLAFSPPSSSPFFSPLSEGYDRGEEERNRDHEAQKRLLFLHGGPIYSLHSSNDSENLRDRPLHDPGRRYRNLLELRSTKLRFLVRDMPTLVKRYLLIRYEDLLHDFEATMRLLQRQGRLTRRRDMFGRFPVNVVPPSSSSLLLSKEEKKKKKREIVQWTDVRPFLDLSLERKMGYVKEC